MALSFLSNPTVQANPAMLAQANTLANQAVTIAEDTVANLASQAKSTTTSQSLGATGSVANTNPPGTVIEHQSSIGGEGRIISQSGYPLYYQVMEEAQLNFGSGMKRPIDLGQPAVQPGQRIAGQLGFQCTYIYTSEDRENLAGQPQPNSFTCTDSLASDEALFPSISNANLLLRIQFATSTITTTTQADTSGSFSFSLPTSCSSVYDVLISNDGYNVSQINVTNTSANGTDIYGNRTCGDSSSTPQ